MWTYSKGVERKKNETEIDVDLRVDSIALPAPADYS
jgi:hypothetical protein